MRKIILDILLLVMLAFIWGNSLLPGEQSGEMSDTVLETLNGIAARIGLPKDTFTYYCDTDGDGIPEPTGLLVRKLAHMMEFAVFGALIWLRLETRGRKRALQAFLLSAAAAGADELIQRFSADRGSRLTDVMIDCFGAALGLLLVTGLSWLIRRRRVKSDT